MDCQLRRCLWPASVQEKTENETSRFCRRIIGMGCKCILDSSIRKRVQQNLCAAARNDSHASCVVCAGADASEAGHGHSAKALQLDFPPCSCFSVEAAGGLETPTATLPYSASSCEPASWWHAFVIVVYMLRIIRNIAAVRKLRWLW